VKVVAQRPPLFRIICHCTICQSFNRAAFADVSVFRAKDVIVPPGNLVDFRTYRPPPAIRRGKCARCGGPAVELAAIPPLAIVPSANFDDVSFLPVPAFHIFYERRVSDAEDDVPKHSGYWPSQLAFLSRYVTSLRRGQASA